MPDTCVRIIDTLIEERNRQGKTQRDIAEATGFPQSVIARLESKKVTPKLDTLLKVAAALNQSIAVVPAER